MFDAVTRTRSSLQLILHRIRYTGNCREVVLFNNSTLYILRFQGRISVIYIQ